MSIGEKKDTEGYFEQYWRHASALRNWFIAYGIGAAIFCVSKADVFAEFPAYTKQIIIFAFLLGVFVQVLLAFWNKIGHWFIYRGEDDPSYRSTKTYKFWDKATEWFWIDISIDIITFCSFAFATYKLFIAFKDFG